jgi:hypothetical protein
VFFFCTFIIIIIIIITGGVIVVSYSGTRWTRTTTVIIKRLKMCFMYDEKKLKRVDEHYYQMLEYLKNKSYSLSPPSVISN